MSGHSKYPSPDGRYEFVIVAWEARASLWVENPVLVDKTTDRTLLRFSDDRWSLDSAKWISGTVVVMILRKFPGDHRPSSFDLVFDCAGLTATVGPEDSVPVAQIERNLDKLYLAAKRK